MPDRLSEEFSTLLRRTTVRIELDGTQAWAIMVAVRLACKQAGFTGQARDIAEVFARRVEQQLTAGPARALMVGRLASQWIFDHPCQGAAAPQG